MTLRHATLRAARNHAERCARGRANSRRATALLVTLFVLTISSLLVIAIWDTETSQLAALRHVGYYERAGYLAGSAVQEACVYLETDKTWRVGIPSTEFPAGSGNTYSATAASSTGNRVVVTGVGNSGGVTRTLTVTLDFD